MIRKQILLKEEQRRALERLAREQARSVSEIVRSMIDAQLRVENEQRLREAAERLRDDYLSDPELTAFMAIEQDPFYSSQ